MESPSILNNVASPGGNAEESGGEQRVAHYGQAAERQEEDER